MAPRSACKPRGGVFVLVSLLPCLFLSSCAPWDSTRAYRGEVSPMRGLEFVCMIHPTVCGRPPAVIGGGRG